MFDHSNAPPRSDGGASVAPTFAGARAGAREWADPGLRAALSAAVVAHGSDDPAVLGARFEQLLQAWWLDGRPDWTGPDWWDTPLRDEVRGLLWLAPGPDLAAALVQVSNPGPCSLSHAGEAPPGWPSPGHAPGWPCACQVVVAAAWEACAAWAAAGSAAALVAAAGADEVAFLPPAPSPRVTEPAQEELALALRVSPLSMGNRIAAARELMAHPGLVELVESAAISAWGARLIVREVAGLPEDVAARIVGEVVERIRVRLVSGRRPWTSAEVGRAARVLRLRLAPDEEQSIRGRARSDRRVQVFEDRHGMAVLHALIDATSAHRIHRRLSAIAQGLEDPERSCDQVRADVLVDLLLGHAEGLRPGRGPISVVRPDPSDRGPAGAEAGADPRSGAPADLPVESGAGVRPGARPEINVVVSLATLLGFAGDPGEVTGLGPIPAEMARLLAADGVWRAWITDASGAVVSTGSRSYVPSAGLARLVRAREPHCRMPGCRRAAERSDLDHSIPWPRGSTSMANLGPLCRRHHVLKTHAGWSLVPTGPPGDPDARPPRGPTAGAPDDASGTGPAPGDRGESAMSGGWSWRTPAGFTVRETPTPPLG